MPTLAQPNYSGTAHSMFSVDWINNFIDQGLQAYQGITEAEIARDRARLASQVPGTVGQTPSSIPSTASVMGFLDSGAGRAVMFGGLAFLGVLAFKKLS